MISNSTPIEATTFASLWINNVSITSQRSTITALPYNGTHVLTSPTKRYSGELDETLHTKIGNAIRRKCGNTTKPLLQLIVSAPSPDRPVFIRALFAETEKPFIIPDAFKLAGTDPVFAQDFTSIMYSLGQLLTA